MKDDLQHSQHIPPEIIEQLRDLFKISTGKMRAIAREEWAYKIASLENKDAEHDIAIKEHGGVLDFIRRKLGVKRKS